jgi:type IV pilus assembly protein PilQ
MCHRNYLNGRSNNVKGLLVWGFVLVMTAVLVVSDVSGAEAQPPTGKPIKSFKLEEDFGVRKALAMLASMYEKNIVPTPNVDGALAFRSLTKVSFEEAMDAILGENFVYEQKGNLIRVYTKDEYKKLMADPDRMRYEVFTLYYISAAEAKKLIMPLLSQNGRIETTTAAVTEFPTGESISRGSGGGDAPAMNDTVVVYDFPEILEQVGKVLQEVDIRPKQVLVEATILSVTLTEDTQFGIEWQTLKSTITQLADITRGTPDYLATAGTLGRQEVPNSGGLTVGLAYDDVGVFIRALDEVSDVTVLANPKILAVNKQLGQVYIGKKLGYREGNVIGEGGVVQEGKVSFLDTGTKLSFRPYIGDDGYIRMDIHPKDSDGQAPAGVPEETSAELVTNIIVKDGQTVVIGGLLRDSVTTGRTQVPLLGDIPLLGVLFRSTADQTKREEVIVLLTPHIVEDPSQTEGAARAEDISRKRTAAKDELQWISRSRLAEDRYALAARYYLEGNNESAMKELCITLWLRPNYLEAIRLKERILAETDPAEAEKLERVMREAIDQQEASKWMRR